MPEVINHNCQFAVRLIPLWWSRPVGKMIDNDTIASNFLSRSL